MQTVEQIRSDAQRVLRHVLTHFSQNNDVTGSTAIACNCDPNAASLYVFVACDDDEIFDDPWFWSGHLVEQECPSYEQPEWFAEFNELNSLYISATDEDNSEYPKIEQYFNRILEGVSLALISIKSELTTLQYPDNIKLAVMTEDDDDEKTMFERVESLIDNK